MKKYYDTYVRITIEAETELDAIDRVDNALMATPDIASWQIQSAEETEYKSYE